MEQPDLLQSNVQCMGLNTFGQLGDGTNNDWTIPVPVYYDLDDKVVRAQLVTAGDNFSCALIEDANVQCWGSNAFGQIGNTALIRDETYRPFNVKLDNQP
jgi:alpha-tubulin suppressor-like RCC1 family protein